MTLNDFQTDSSQSLLIQRAGGLPEPDLLRLVRSAWRSFRVQHSVLAIVGRPGVPEGRARRPGDVPAAAEKHPKS